MLLIVEIFATIIAWRRGWRWSALLPLAAALLIGLFLGGTGPLLGEEVKGGFTSFLLVDLTCIGTLTGMAAYRPVKKNYSE